MEDDQREALFTSIQNYLFHSHKIRNSADFCKCLDFIAKAPRYAPFNAFLVYLQNSEAEYFAEERIWEKHGRKLKPHAQPLLILWPFSGPVRLLFDVKDTEGVSLLKEGFLHWWSNRALFGDKLIENTEWFLELERKKGEERGIQVPAWVTKGYKDIGRDRYVQACRSLGHYLLGHGGRIYAPTSRGADRSGLSPEVKEFELDALVFLVLKRFGMILDPADCLMEGSGDVDELVRYMSIPVIARAVGQIERAGARKPSMTKYRSKKEDKIFPGIPLPELFS